MFFEHSKQCSYYVFEIGCSIKLNEMFKFFQQILTAIKTLLFCTISMISVNNLHALYTAYSTVFETEYYHFVIFFNKKIGRFWGKKLHQIFQLVVISLSQNLHQLFNFKNSQLFAEYNQHDLSILITFFVLVL